MLLNISENEKDDFLFVKNDIYKFKLEYELSIISCYSGDSFYKIKFIF